MPIKDTLRRVKDAIADIRKSHGQEAIMTLGGDDGGPRREVETFPSGSLGLDAALGMGGFPKGRVVEMFGPESSGKTTLALHAIASMQRSGGVAAFIDAEHALDPKWAETLGVKCADLLVSQPDCGEQALEIAEALVKSSHVGLVVIDSVAALVPKAEIEGEMGDSHVGLHARLMSQAMRKLTGHIARSGCTVIFINQVRHKIGVMFGSPETTTGGNALKFYASVRVDVRRIGTVKSADAVVGSRVRTKVVKNKIAAPFREAEFDIMYGEGISATGELLDHGLQGGFIDKSGSWYAFEGERIGQGREKAREWLSAHAEAATRLRALVLGEVPSPKPNGESTAA
ncbi:MAG: recombinase RecA [Myxococcota bacterium]